VSAPPAPLAGWSRLDACASTQDALWARPELLGVYTDSQWAGRGRLGRAWAAPAGACLCLSWRPPLAGLAPALLPRLSLAAGVAVARLARGLLAGAGAGEGARAELALKWPNDALWRGRKLAGVLCEARAAGEGALAAVVGVGLNLTPHPALPAAAVSLQEALGAPPPPLDALAAALAAELEGALALLRASPAALGDVWGAHALPLGTPMRCMGVAGRFAGLGEEGGLLLDTDAGRVTMESGEAEVLARLPAP